MISEIHRKLLSMKNEKYLEFNAKIIKNTRYELIGVRLPELRNYSKQLLKQDWQNSFKDYYYEEVLLHGFCIAGYRCDWDTKKKMIDEYIKLIDNWGICDSFVASLKDIKKNRSDYYPVIKKYLKTKSEFIQRYALVVLLDYYVDKEYLNDLFHIIKTQKYIGYYSKMAGAWLLSYLFMFYFDETLKYVKENKIDDFIYKKGIQKSLDSYRLDKKQKSILKALNHA